MTATLGQRISLDSNCSLMLDEEDPTMLKSEASTIDLIGSTETDENSDLLPFEA